MSYSIYLDGSYLGETEFENADPPMGVVMGRIKVENSKSFFSYIKDYCEQQKVPFEIDPEHDWIATQNIKGIKVFNKDKVEIKGLGSTIYGMSEEGYEIDVFGIPYPFYGEEFKHHRETYDNKWKEV